MSRLPLLYRFPGGFYNVFVKRALRQNRIKVWQSLEPHLETPDQRVLLPGGGTGLDLPHTKRQRPVLLDLAPKMLAASPWREQDRCSALCADGERMPFADHTFDLVAAHLIVQIVPDGMALLGECWRVLNPGGLLSVWDKFPGGEAGIPGFLRPLSAVTRTFATGFALGLQAVEDSCPGARVSEGATLTGPFVHRLYRKVE